MKLYNIEKHLNCFCYDKGELQTVEVRNFTGGEENEVALFANEMVLITNGKIKIAMRDSSEGELCEGEVVFLPAGDYLTYKAVVDSTVLIMRLNFITRLCQVLNVDRLYSSADEIKEAKGLYTLKINSYLRHFVKGLLNNYETGLRCRVFMQSEVTKFLIMLMAYYPEKDLSLFFYPILSPNAAFSEYVRMNWLKYGNVNRLAAGMSMSPQQLTKRFYSAFGMPPHKWMKREKAQMIYGDICMSNKSFKEIADEYGFNVPAHFSRFCKTTFGITPGEIRKKGKL